MPGVVMNGKVVPVPGIDVANYLENPKLAILTPEDGYVSGENWRARNITLHTTRGIPGGKDKRPQVLHPGLGPDTNVGERSAAYCRNNPDSVGANGRARNGGHHLTFDGNGKLYCHMDLIRVVGYHGRACNRHSIGIEIWQDGRTAGLWEGQLAAVVAFLDWLTRSVVTQTGAPAPIQRQVHFPYLGRPISRLGLGANGRNVVGIYGHRDADDNRGAGDPGDFIFQKLITAGYERYNFGANQDLEVWEKRQGESLGLTPDQHGDFHDPRVDGVPGPGTAMTLKSQGRAHGLWVSRPGD